MSGFLFTFGALMTCGVLSTYDAMRSFGVLLKYDVLYACGVLVAYGELLNFEVVDYLGSLGFNGLHMKYDALRYHGVL